MGEVIFKVKVSNMKCFKEIKYTAMAVISAAMFASCATTTRPVAATSNPVGNKCGEASCVRVLGIFGGSSNVGLNKAVKNGGITKISHVDYVTKRCLGGFLYTKTTTRVYGE